MIATVKNYHSFVTQILKFNFVQRIRVELI